MHFEKERNLRKSIDLAVLRKLSKVKIKEEGNSESSEPDLYIDSFRTDKSMKEQEKKKSPRLVSILKRKNLITERSLIETLPEPQEKVSSSSGLSTLDDETPN